MQLQRKVNGNFGTRDSHVRFGFLRLHNEGDESLRKAILLLNDTNKTNAIFLPHLFDEMNGRSDSRNGIVEQHGVNAKERNSRFGWLDENKIASNGGRLQGQS